MKLSFDSERWRGRAASALAQLVAIFVGVTLAFLFEGYRKQLDEAADLRDAVASVIIELGHYEERGTVHARRFKQSIEAWRAADRAGRKEVLALYRVPGALRPPAAAWESAVASGLVTQLEPSLALELGYFYNEYLGIQENYLRREIYAEQEIMPRSLQGADAFYDAEGRLRPEFQVHLTLLGEFAADAERLSLRAGELKRKLVALQAAEE